MDLFRPELTKIIDPSHGLVKLGRMGTPMILRAHGDAHDFMRFYIGEGIYGMFVQNVLDE